MKNKKSKIAIAGPSITQREVDYVAKAVKDGWYKNAYTYVGEFERKFAAYIGVKYALATPSCTGALHLALLALHIKEGDEVILPDSTWAASVFPVSYVRANPVFVDIDKDSWCIDPERIEAKITRRTKAIIPVHLYGHPADMKKILFIAKKYKLKVIEDAAESIGATYFGKRTGSMGDAGCFSFHGTKTLTTGEGGMLVTNSSKIYERARFLSDQAKSPKKGFWNLEVGYKNKMSDIQAALGTVQLSRMNELLRRKRKIFHWYEKRLGKCTGITVNCEKPGCRNSYWMVTVVLDKKYKMSKIQLMENLLKYNIVSRPFFYPVSSLPPYKTKVDNPIASALSEYAVNLPCSLEISQDEVDYICRSLLFILGNENHKNISE